MPEDDGQAQGELRQFSSGKEYLGKTYLELFDDEPPPRKRGHQVLPKMSGDALAFFREEKKTKEAAEVERIQRGGVDFVQ